MYGVLLWVRWRSGWALAHPGFPPFLGAVLAAVALAVYEVQARIQAFAALSAMQAVRLRIMR